MVHSDAYQSSGFPGEGANLYKLSLSSFQRHLDALTAAVGNSMGLLGDGRDVVLTFDDGGVSAITLIADELERRQLRGYFFVATDFVGEPGFMNKKQIRDLHSRGHVIGSHSCSHPPMLNRLPYDTILDEWRTSVERLSDWTGSAVTVASVPGGYYSKQVARAAAEAGIGTLFTSEPTDRVGMVDGCHILGRHSIQRDTPPSRAVDYATGAPLALAGEWAFWNAKKAAKRLGGPLYLRAREAVLARRNDRGAVAAWSAAELGAELAPLLPL